jgi:methylated-DNA-[protein]-cysteine S-methyltransferase
MFYYVCFKSRLGWISALSSSRGIVQTTFPQISRELSLSSLTLKTAEAASSSEQFNELISYFEDYFDGKKPIFKGILDLTQATDFQRIVWQTAMLIPYGETRSYTWIAHNMGRPLSCRAVGNALGKNPLPLIVPCHRVIKADDSLGGFGGGLDMKRFLLKLERQ